MNLSVSVADKMELTEAWPVFPRDKLNEVPELVYTGTTVFVYHAYIEVLRARKSIPTLGIWRVYEA